MSSKLPCTRHLNIEVRIGQGVNVGNAETIEHQVVAFAKRMQRLWPLSANVFCYSDDFFKGHTDLTSLLSGTRPDPSHDLEITG